MINLGSGNLQTGCVEVTAQISPAGSNHYSVKCRGSLPPAPELEQLYQNWQLLYQEFCREGSSRSGPTQNPSSASTRMIQVESYGVTNFSEVEFREVCQQLITSLNTWLSSESFHAIERRLYRELSPDEEVWLVIETNNNLVRRLPWHLWHFFEDYPQAEVALSALEYGQVQSPFQTPKSQVRILAILGNSQGLDLEADRRAIAALPGAAPLFLESPRRRELDEALWDSQGWDILFFAGHSQTEAKTGAGRIQINPTTSLTLDELRLGLRRAIHHGLKLAIFNSCDGLGLVRDLADLQIPQMIVMREPVSDTVAQEFFRYFLEAFSGGQSLYASVREARERLEKLEDDYPCATWLPVICQNPAVAPSTWQEWCDQTLDNSAISTAPPQTPQCSLMGHHFKRVLLLSLVVTGLVMGVRWLGLLQSLELQAFDQVLRLRPDEGLDRRLLIVTITEEDFKLPQQKQRKGSLSEEALAQLLQKLGQFKPRAIGLDIYRDFPVDAKQTDLASQMRQDTSLFAICQVSDPPANEPGVAPPPEIPPERQGFSDFVKDPDGVLRRHLLAMKADKSTSPCTAPYALSAQLAFRYLEAEGISVKYTQNEELQIGQVVFKRLRNHMGSYQHVDTEGYQTWLNYRSYRSPLEMAETVTLTDVLTGSLKPETVNDRVVLIGVTAQSAGDFFMTPYSTGQVPSQEMPGVIVHAQMVSQILSAVLNERPLLWVWPAWGETLWVFCWSVLGGILVWKIRKPLYLVLAVTSGVAMLNTACFCLMTQGGWIPLVPPALAVVATAGGVAAVNRSKAGKQFRLPPQASQKSS